MSVVKSLEIESSEKAFVQNSQLTMATFNLFNYLEPPNAFYDFDRIYSTEQWRKKQQWICDYLDEYQPDVIGFQEVFSAESLKSLVNKAGYQYFSVVDQPQIIDDFIYKNPVVAIASKYPIVDSSSPKSDSELAVAMGLSCDFSFSRKVLRATIDLPHIGLCDCYVVHFKSKRSMIEAPIDKTQSLKKNIIDQFKYQIAGKWASSIQRGSEAALLMTCIIERREEKTLPMVLMGDFNSSVGDEVLNHLLTESLSFPLSQSTTKEAKSVLNQYCLKDAWDLHLAFIGGDSPKKVQHSRKFTHYYGAKGSVLDYILLSCEFDVSYQGSIFELSSYHVYDRHLINPKFDRDGQSTDHAVVAVTFSLRS